MSAYWLSCARTLTCALSLPIQPIPPAVTFSNAVSNAQSSKLRLERLFCHVSVKRDVRALSCERAFENVTAGGIGCILTGFFFLRSRFSPSTTSKRIGKIQVHYSWTTVVTVGEDSCVIHICIPWPQCRLNCQPEGPLIRFIIKLIVDSWLGLGKISTVNHFCTLKKFHFWTSESPHPKNASGCKSSFQPFQRVERPMNVATETVTVTWTESRGM